MFNQISMSKMGKILNFCSGWATSHQHRGLGWSLGTGVDGRGEFVLESLESSPFLALRQSESRFQPSNLHLKKVANWKLNMKKVYLRLVWRQRLHTADHFPSRIQHRPDQTIDTRWCPHTWELFVPHLRGRFLVACNWNSGSMIIQEVLSLRQQ